jgi:hypothetical protein
MFASRGHASESPEETRTTHTTPPVYRACLALDQAVTELERGVDVVRTRRFVRRPLVGGAEVLSRRLRRELEVSTQSGEQIHFCLRGELGNALVCLDDRLLILKRGFHAGTTFGAMTATIFYPDVTGIQVRMHLVSGWIEISSPSFQGSDHRGRARSQGAGSSVFKQPNCVPVSRRHVGAYREALAELRRLVAVSKLEQHNGLVDQLERLATLRQRGLLDEREFSAAKSKLVEAAAAQLRRPA